MGFVFLVVKSMYFLLEVLVCFVELVVVVKEWGYQVVGFVDVWVLYGVVNFVCWVN